MSVKGTKLPWSWKWEKCEQKSNLGFLWRELWTVITLTSIFPITIQKKFLTKLDILTLIFKLQFWKNFWRNETFKKYLAHKLTDALSNFVTFEKFSVYWPFFWKSISLEFMFFPFQSSKCNNSFNFQGRELGEVSFSKSLASSWKPEFRRIIILFNLTYHINFPLPYYWYQHRTINEKIFLRSKRRNIRVYKDNEKFS